MRNKTRQTANVENTQEPRGRKRDELHPGLKSFPVGMYLIFYLPISGGIQIVRVLHGMMDIDAYF